MKTINVTQDHINNGGVTCGNCPIAMALKDVFPDRCVMVNKSVMVVSSNWLSPFTHTLPHTAETRRFVDTYDNDGRTAVSPFSFEIDLE